MHSSSKLHSTQWHTHCKPWETFTNWLFCWFFVDSLLLSFDLAAKCGNQDPVVTLYISRWWLQEPTYEADFDFAMNKGSCPEDCDTKLWAFIADCDIHQVGGLAFQWLPPMGMPVSIKSFLWNLQRFLRKQNNTDSNDDITIPIPIPIPIYQYTNIPVQYIPIIVVLLLVLIPILLASATSFHSRREANSSSSSSSSTCPRTNTNATVALLLYTTSTL